LLADMPASEGTLRAFPIQKTVCMTGFSLVRIEGGKEARGSCTRVTKG